MSDADDIRNLEIDPTPLTPPAATPTVKAPMTPAERTAIEKKAKNAGALVLIFGMLGLVAVVALLVAATNTGESTPDNESARRALASRMQQSMRDSGKTLVRIAATGGEAKILTLTAFNCDRAMLIEFTGSVGDVLRKFGFEHTECDGGPRITVGP